MGLKQSLKFITNHPLNQGQKLTSIYRFFRWQIKSRLSKGFSTHPFAEKSKILVKSGLTGATGNIYTGLHEFDDMSFLLHFLREDDMFFDIGANVGSYTILSASECNCSTISIEPIPTTFNILKKNVALNHIEDKTELLNIGLGKQDGVLRFTKSLDTVNHVAENDEIESIDVDVKCFDNSFEIKTTTLIKMDVEGYETEVLKGMIKTLQNKNLKAIIIELNGSGNRYGYNEDEIHKNLLSFGYLPYKYYPFKRELLERETYGNLNTIYIKDYDFVSSRLVSSRKFKINGYSY